VDNHTLAASGPGTVVLDLGPGVGALVLHAMAAEEGREIDISPVGGGARTHSAVRERRMPGGSVYCAVYPSVPAGDYTVWLTPPVVVSVVAGTVTEFRR
jgi:hypothetical protein